MRLAAGIFVLIGALWFLYGTVRLWPPGTYRRRFLFPSTWGHIILALILTAACAGVGIFLIWG